MAEEPVVAIAIISWNVKEAVRSCLASIDRVADVPFELFVVDNHSIDGAAELAMAYVPQNPRCVRYTPLLNDRNRGYGTAANQAIQEKRAPYFLLLNQDTVLPPQALSTLIRTAETASDIGLVGVHLLNADGSLQQSVSDFPSFFGQLARRLGVAKRGPRFDYSKTQNVDVIKGAVMLFTPQALECVSGFDEGFFLWFEENDYCARLHAAGLRAVYTPEVTVTHVGQTAFVKVSWWTRQWIWNQSIRRYFCKQNGIVAGMAMGVLDPLCMFVGMALARLQKRK